MIFLMKIAALERTKHIASRAAGGAALGAVLGAAERKISGGDWKDGAKAGAVVGGALGMARGAHNVRRYTHIGKGVAAERGEAHGSNSDSFKRGKGFSDDRKKQRADEAYADIKARRDAPAHTRDHVADRAKDIQDRNRAQDKREMEYLRRRGKGQNPLHSASMTGHNPFSKDL